MPQEELCLGVRWKKKGLKKEFNHSLKKLDMDRALVTSSY